MSNRKVYPPFITYCAKVIPLAFNESMSYYECICNITNHINNEIIPVVNENSDIVNQNKKDFDELKQYVDDNMLTKDINDLTYYTLTNDLSSVALSGNYNDLTNKPTIPDVSNFITKDVNDLTYYTLTSDLSSVALSGNYNDLTNKPTIPDVSNFITKDVNDLTYYTLTNDLSSVATSGNYNDLTNKPTIPDVSNFITKDVNDLTYYTLSTTLTTLLGDKENVIEKGSNTNGYYIKFSNGTLIQYGSLAIPSLACTTGYGSFYYGTTSAIAFPIQFNNLYSLTPTLQSNGIGSICVSQSSNSSFTCRCINGTSGNITATVFWIAIGN